jgi:hypothetical protein
MSIRTTVTLDEDVVDRLKQEARSKGIPFRQALNDTLRSGLLVSRKSPEAPVFRIVPKHMGTRPGLNYDNVSALLELGEGENHK